MTDTAMKAAADKALSLVGQGYIYGAKGQTCSPLFRARQAEQYPEQAQHILGEGAKWDGAPVWDCAQLTRAAAKAAGFTLPSGAASQWNRGAWKRKGTADSLPKGEAVFVFRQSGGRMQHVGVALGDGTCVHARGTAYGVVRQQMQEYVWTHWASPWGEEAPVIATAEVWAQRGDTVNVRAQPGGSIVGRLPVGTQVEITARSAGWSAIRHEGGTAYMQSAFLKEHTPAALEERVLRIEQRLAKAGL